MIHKTADPVTRTGRFAPAGARAEKQMAFYLHRRYAESADVHVLNDLRLKRNGDVAQIDHLVIHRWGMVIVESKSVTEAIEINELLEFERVHGRGRRGTDSPIRQAERQADLLRKLLIDAKEKLRNKAIFGLVQGGFQHCPIDVRVAISDSGRVTGSGRVKAAAQVLKADAITESIDALIERHRKASGILGKPDGTFGVYSLAEDEIDRVVAFLLERHLPRGANDDADDPDDSAPAAALAEPGAATRASSPPARPRRSSPAVTSPQRTSAPPSAPRAAPPSAPPSARPSDSATPPRRAPASAPSASPATATHLAETASPPPAPTTRAPTPAPPPSAGAPAAAGRAPSTDPAKTPTYLCTHCHSTNLTIRFGRSYYFKCLDCDGNTAIANACPRCGQRTRTTKRGGEYSSICETCGAAQVFFRG